MAPQKKPAHLTPSELGTKEYWDSLYEKELANHADNPDDTGTVWFDDADAETKMVQFLADFSDEGSLCTRTILDLGCGNGSLLRAVRDELFADDDPAAEDGDDASVPPPRPRLLGVDYSSASISLAQSIAHTNEEEDDSDVMPRIDFAVWDMLEGSAADLADAGKVPSSWDLVLDKGTFDAISLGNRNNDGSDGDDQPSVEARYRAQVLNLLRPGGRFLITSCNWTETELCTWMAEDEQDQKTGAWLVKTGRVAYPSFQFGGAQGQAVCTVCFEKCVKASDA